MPESKVQPCPSTAQEGLNYSEPTYFDVPDLIDTDGLKVLAAPGEDRDGNDVVSLAISAGPTLFDINLTPAQALAVGERLVESAQVFTVGGAA